MCRRIDCPKCGRPTFAGCGMHVEQVLGDVPPAERCRCRDSSGKSATGPGAGPGAGPRSWLRGLLGK
jgi:hypothetical protein